MDDKSILPESICESIHKITCTFLPSHSFPPPSVSPLRSVNDVFCTSPGSRVSDLAAILCSPLVHLTTDTEYSDDTSPVFPTSTVSVP